MSALDNIVEEILTEARTKADRILSDALSKAEKIRKREQVRAVEQSELIERQTDKQIADIKSRCEIATTLRRRQVILETQKEELEETILAVRQALLDQPKNEYFAFIVKMVALVAEKGKGELMFNAIDRSVLPRYFQQILNLVLPEENKVNVSYIAADIDGGFVLKYVGLEKDCSFGALFKQRQDEFFELIRGDLFEENGQE